jgi:hypothetical protein
MQQEMQVQVMAVLVDKEFFLTLQDLLLNEVVEVVVA